MTNQTLPGSFDALVVALQYPNSNNYNESHSLSLGLVTATENFFDDPISLPEYAKAGLGEVIQSFLADADNHRKLLIILERIKWPGKQSRPERVGFTRDVFCQEGFFFLQSLACGVGADKKRQTFPISHHALDDIFSDYMTRLIVQGDMEKLRIFIVQGDFPNSFANGLYSGIGALAGHQIKLMGPFYDGVSYVDTVSFNGTPQEAENIIGRLMDTIPAYIRSFEKIATIYTDALQSAGLPADQANSAKNRLMSSRHQRPQERPCTGSQPPPGATIR